MKLFGGVNMKISLAKFYKTRSGRAARIYCVNSGGKFSVHGSVYSARRSEWDIMRWDAFGKCEDNRYDLIEAKKFIKRTYWVNVYKECDDEALSNISYGYATKEAANAAHYIQLGHIKDDDRIACVQVTLSCIEGDGLEEQK